MLVAMRCSLLFHFARCFARRLFPPIGSFRGGCLSAYSFLRVGSFLGSFPNASLHRVLSLSPLFVSSPPFLFSPVPVAPPSFLACFSSSHLPSSCRALSFGPSFRIFVSSAIRDVLFSLAIFSAPPHLSVSDAPGFLGRIHVSPLSIIDVIPLPHPHTSGFAHLSPVLSPPFLADCAHSFLLVPLPLRVPFSIPHRDFLRMDRLRLGVSLSERFSFMSPVLVLRFRERCAPECMGKKGFRASHMRAFAFLI